MKYVNDRGGVPGQGAAKLRPNAHRRGVRDQPVEEPRAAQVQQRIEAGLNDREERHRLGEAVDAGAP